MFVAVKNAFRETLILNSDNIEVILQQQDGDVFVNMRSGESYKLPPSSMETLMEKLGN